MAWEWSLRPHYYLPVFAAPFDFVITNKDGFIVLSSQLDHFRWHLYMKFENITFLLLFFFIDTTKNKQLKHLFFLVIVKASSGPRYVVGCRSKVDKEKLTSGTRVVLDMTTLTIMRTLPREVYLFV